MLTSFGDGGRQPGQFFGVHSIATDSKGNIYTTETYEGKRLQKFVLQGHGAGHRAATRAPSGNGDGSQEPSPFHFSAGAPGTGSLHAVIFAGLAGVAVGEELVRGGCGPAAQAFHEVPR